jgi:DNA-directed RNA polymerase subunit RPC12/RpoP
MQLQLNYICDVCESKFFIDLQNAMKEKKIQCPTCQVVYNFSEEDLQKFNECYNNFVKKMKEAKEK